VLTRPQDIAAYDKELTALERMAGWGEKAQAVCQQIADEYRTGEVIQSQI
jgi:hypothetical protein